MISFPMNRLLIDLGVPGQDLLLRDYGQRALPVLEHELLRVPLGRALTLDFGGISVMDTSFGDETVVELASRLIQGRYGDRFLMVERPSPATRDNLEGTIARRKAKLALLIREDGLVLVLGHLEPNLAEAWEQVRTKQTLTARSLADQLRLEINTASTRLLKLHGARLLARREEISSAGRQHVYQVPL